MKTMIAIEFKDLPGPLYTPLPDNRFVLHHLRGYETRVFDDGSTETLGVATRVIAWKLGGAGKPGGDGGEPIPVANDVRAAWAQTA